MIELFVDGHRIGSWAEAEQLLVKLAAEQQNIEVRDESGRILGHFVPSDPPFPEQEELDRRCAAGGGIPLAAFWKKMGVE